MKFFVALCALAALAHGKVVEVPDNHSVYGFLENSIKEAERFRELEESFISQQRIVGGLPAAIGQYPYKAGLISDIIGLQGNGICGGSLLNANRVLTAAHCWFDGVHQGWRFTVVLGSITLFSGGTRSQTSVVVSHPNYSALLARNDVAVAYLPNSVTFSDIIAPVSLPTGAELNEDFADASAIASGFGLTADGGSIPNSQSLSHVRLNVITNSVCRFSFPLILQDSNLCTSGIGGVGVCGGDSGGPLVVQRNNRDILIGVTSFGSALGCQVNWPSAYARVNSFIGFINQNML